MDRSAVPSWDGSPATFESYVTAAKWYEKGTKQSERSLVVARLWGQLSGAAKSVVRYLEPDQYEGSDGLSRFIEVLRQSPLQSLPIPDSFTRLEKWHGLRRTDHESISEMIVREEELFTELQQSLIRARKDRVTSPSPMSPVESTRDPPSTPSRSPTAAASGPQARDAKEGAGGSKDGQSMYPPLPTLTASPSSSDFFEDELRGYRLLRACRISGQERQNVLVQTGNSTSFTLIRRALRTLYAEESEKTTNARKAGRIWFGEWEADVPGDDDWYEQSWWNEWDDWADASPDSQSYWYDDEESWFGYGETDDYDEVQPNEQSTDPEEVQLVEAFSLANEASRTLKDAREAVRQVRLARGYYMPQNQSAEKVWFHPQLRLHLVRRLEKGSPR